MSDWEKAAETVVENYGAMTRRAPWDKQTEWDRAYIRTVSTRMPKREVEKLNYYCREENVTKYLLFQTLARLWIAEMEKIYGE